MTFYDHKAERIAAAAQAEAARAAAEIQRAQAKATLLAAQTRAKEERADARAARVSSALRAVSGWLAGHVVELALSVIVVVPAIMAWSAMAAYGAKIYGPVGWGLPLFSEAAMWAFAFAAHAARKNGNPTGWLQAGVWTFAAVAAVLNFIHGATMREGGLADGVVMALVSVGGVVAHQLITAAPTRSRRSRAERRAARTERIAARRVTRMQRAAVRRAVGQLAADGTVRLLHTPGVVTLHRGWTGRLQLAPYTLPGEGADGPASELDGLDAELRALLADAVESTPVEARPEPTSTAPDSPVDLQESRARRGSIPEPARRSFDQLRAELRAAVEAGQVDPTSAESIRKNLRCAARTARQLRDDWTNGSGSPVAA
ncbi:DUF2637 domain-containing protein [Saccharopolyspora hirsuta]|uniref:DUF2637 domain-containing protein n=1 Tax=Saccharopolyspora hirsuta TaxID=1837 RepID=A0A5M7BN38_SACHI|nr:DUF2637 domain-containing protein [Saccharopolyspora hirsuta]KAA5829558.1 DUF2637 domain-containing protein [Saccharopolyspora hirsuta]